MTERERLLRQKQGAEELWQLLNNRVQRAQQAQIRETRFEEQERLEQVLLDARRRLQEAEAELSEIKARLDALPAGHELPEGAEPAVHEAGRGPLPTVATPTRPELRRLLERLFVGDADLDAFCIDYCAEVQNRFTLGMERAQKLSLLLVHIPEPELLKRLRLHSPSTVSALLGERE